MVLAINELFISSNRAFFGKQNDNIIYSAYNCSNQFVKGTDIKFHKFPLANDEKGIFIQTNEMELFVWKAF